MQSSSRNNRTRDSLSFTRCLHTLLPQPLYTLLLTNGRSRKEYSMSLVRLQVHIGVKCRSPDLSVEPKGIPHRLLSTIIDRRNSVPRPFNSTKHLPNFLLYLLFRASILLHPHLHVLISPVLPTLSCSSALIFSKKASSHRMLNAVSKTLVA